MKPITPNEYEQMRRIKCQQLGIRYTKLAPRQLIEEVIKHNNRVKEQEIA